MERGEGGSCTRPYAGEGGEEGGGSGVRPPNCCKEITGGGVGKGAGGSTKDWCYGLQRGLGGEHLV